MLIILVIMEDKKNCLFFSLSVDKLLNSGVALFKPVCVISRCEAQRLLINCRDACHYSAPYVFNTTEISRLLDDCVSSKHSVFARFEKDSELIFQLVVVVVVL